MDLIVELGVSDEAHGVRHVDPLVEGRHRVQADGIGGTPAAVAVDACVIVDGLGGVVFEGGTYCSGVGEAVVDVHSLAVEGNGEVLVEEARVEVQREGSTLEIRGLEGTGLGEAADRNAVWKNYALAEFGVAAEADVGLIALSHAENFLLPIGVGVAQGSHRFGIVAVILLHGGLHLLGVQHVHELGVLAHRSGEVGVDVDLAGGGSLLGGDDDDTVGCTRTVD